MSLYDFLYLSLKEGLFCNPLALGIIITLLIFLLLLFIFPYYLVNRIKSFKIGKFGVKTNQNAFEEKHILSFKNHEPAIMKKTDKQNKKTWLFSGAAYNLGKGKDGKTYFIGYFGNDLPPKYVKTTVECETIVGVDWDNTPQWIQAFEDVKNTYKLTVNDAPDYTGNGCRNNRNLHGIFACEKELPNTD
jgi:hypothetical protein